MQDKPSLAIAYAMKKRGSKAASPCEAHGEMGCGMCHGGMMAEGGEAGEQTDSDMLDMVGRIMAKLYSKGGMVANDTFPDAEFDENNFDDLALEDGGMDAADDTGANSGDELGDAQEDDDRRDIVSRIMKSRAKGDRMPRPA